MMNSRVFLFFFFFSFFAFAWGDEENVKLDITEEGIRQDVMTEAESGAQIQAVHIITKGVDLSKLHGTYYEIATNVSGKIMPGLGCRCSKYEISEVDIKENTNPIFHVHFTCERNFLFTNKECELFFKVVLTKPLHENSTTVVEECTTDVYWLKENSQIFIEKNMSLIYAELDEENNNNNDNNNDNNNNNNDNNKKNVMNNNNNGYKHLVFGGPNTLNPLLILSKNKFISYEDYTKILNSLYAAGFDSKLLQWPFIIQTDQTLCK